MKEHHIGRLGLLFSHCCVYCVSRQVLIQVIHPREIPLKSLIFVVFWHGDSYHGRNPSPLFYRELRWKFKKISYDCPASDRKPNFAGTKTSFLRHPSIIRKPPQKSYTCEPAETLSKRMIRKTSLSVEF